MRWSKVQAVLHSSGRVTPSQFSSTKTSPTVGADSPDELISTSIHGGENLESTEPKQQCPRVTSLLRQRLGVSKVLESSRTAKVKFNVRLDQLQVSLGELSRKWWAQTVRNSVQEFKGSPVKVWSFGVNQIWIYPKYLILTKSCGGELAVPFLPTNYKTMVKANEAFIAQRIRTFLNQ